MASNASSAESEPSDNCVWSGSELVLVVLKR